PRMAAARRMTSSERLPIAVGQERSLMRSVHNRTPRAPGTAAVGRSRWAPGAPNAPAAAVAAPGSVADRSATGPMPPSPRRALVLAAVAIVLTGAWLAHAPQARAQGVKLPDAPISAIRFEGNATIPPEKVKVRLLSKVGQPFDPAKVDADV